MSNYNILEYKHFPSIIGQPIIINENTLFFKSYSINYNPLTKNRPSFFGDIDNAIKYLKSDRKLGIFNTKRKIRLLDIRYISDIINDLILLRDNNDIETIKGYMTISLSFGLVSLYKQLNLYKIRYASTLETDVRYKKICKYYNDYEKEQNKQLFQNPVELTGIRIGEINNDVDTTFILKEIFKDFFDGFISPVTFSPYFDNNFIPNEILLFNPIDFLEELDSLPANISTKNIKDILSELGINLFSVPYFMKESEKTFFQYGGYIKNKNNPIDYVFEKNNLIHNIYQNKNKSLHKIKKQGKNFKKIMIMNNISQINKEDYIYNKNEMIIKNNI
jgi:hypothetical protein